MPILRRRPSKGAATAARHINDYAQLVDNEDGTYSMHVKDDPERTQVIAPELNALSENASLGDRLFRRRKAMRVMDQLQRMQRGSIGTRSATDMTTVANPGQTSNKPAITQNPNTETPSTESNTEKVEEIVESGKDDILSKSEAYWKQRQNQQKTAQEAEAAKRKGKGTWEWDREQEIDRDKFAQERYNYYISEGKVDKEVAKELAEVDAIKKFNPDYQTPAVGGWDNAMRAAAMGIESILNPVQFEGQFDMADIWTQRSEYPWLRNINTGKAQLYDIVGDFISDSASGLYDAFANNGANAQGYKNTAQTYNDIKDYWNQFFEND
jgi:hypothetical protein